MLFLFKYMYIFDPQRQKQLHVIRMYYTFEEKGKLKEKNQ